jgi:hypothetical protein
MYVCVFVAAMYVRDMDMDYGHGHGHHARVLCFVRMCINIRHQAALMVHPHAHVRL